MITRLITTTISLIILAGCNSIASKRNDILNTIPSNERAYIIGKFSVDCNPYGSLCSQHFNSISLLYRDKDIHNYPGELKSVVGSIFGSNTDHDFSSLAEKEQGFYFCYAIPPGPYEFYSVKYYNFAGGGSGYSLPDDSYFSLPFTLQKGEVAYIGAFKLTTSVGENAFGMPIRRPGKLIVSAGNPTIINKALEKCPENINSKAVRSYDLTKNNVFHPLVTYEY